MPTSEQVNIVKETLNERGKPVKEEIYFSAGKETTVYFQRWVNGMWVQFKRVVRTVTLH